MHNLVKCRRQKLDTTVGVSDVLLANQDGIVNTEFAGELSNVLFTGVVHGDAEYLKTLWSVLLL